MRQSISEPSELHPHDDDQRTCILVTGANSGLGFAICQRLIDEFIDTRPQFTSLTLIITTRDAPKSADTVSRLQRHCKAKSKPYEAPLSTRITIQPENLDLTSLRSVRALANKLLKGSIPHLDSIICNAGIGNVRGIAWGKAIGSMLTDFVNATTCATPYKICDTGTLTAPQKADGEQQHLPDLGLVFTSNIFGHYMLSHQLVPLLTSTPAGCDTGRIIFVSSLEAVAEAFNPQDIQALKTPQAYESSKRLTDLLVLTSELPSTQPFINRFFASALTPTTTTSADEAPQIRLLDNDIPTDTPISGGGGGGIRMTDSTPRGGASKPSFHLTHPGICATSFVPLPFPLTWLMALAFYIARLLGSQWHTVRPYTGAKAPVWLALATEEEIEDVEVETAGKGMGKGKWGSGVDRWGRVGVRRTGVAGWEGGGLEMIRDEEREGFEEVGRGVWKEMEELRVFWEGQVGKGEE
ncbi:MAG: 3-keto-steroid reductase [Ramalina farinacea]|uniref:3-keto-steroid reductase n=1 Tax=Ramalina farinacea TaxID=258253 RepID=A0AA43QTG1_9LECA|nr:3-keto-steroid reductase [Ramalina farinacea]